ncbi:DUF5047 domain-containing protein [Streptomyces sp. JJ66]|uniref:DUF5047 domain-containing protein n=1 Tax=Streptomyces sp. JJ66 TaxID=2803843 RepID=UPI0027E297F1|nr:DUF5047 domain-containing protein [Streptomyces sp. JJ66]
MAALSESYVPVTVVELHWPDGSVTVVPHTGGSVAVDRGSAVRRTATVESADRSLLPVSAADFLAVAGARLRIRRGMMLDGQPVTVPVFTGRIDSLDGDPEVGPVSIAATGLEAAVADARFEAPYSTRTQAAAVTSITALIRDVLPDAVVASTAPDTVLGPRTWDADSDRWEAIQEIATAVEAEVFADADGVFRIDPLPDVLTAPVAWEAAAGERGALISASTGWSRGGLYNVVVASGENAEADTPPVSAVAEDDDAGSPTWVGGPFGRAPMFYSSPTLTTTALAQQAANKLLADARRPAFTADITALPNPLLEPGDVLRVVYGDGRRTLHQVQALDVDLGVGGPVTLQLLGGKEDA